jgi:hypothetical protein
MEISADLKTINNDGLRVGHSNASCTTIPNYLENQGSVYWDCPGFEETKSVSQEIVNAYYTEKIFSNSGSVKFVVVIQHAIEKLNREQNLADIFELLTRMVPNPNMLFRGLCIVITKCPARYKVESFLATLTDLVNQNDKFRNLACLLNQIINCKSKIALLKQPADEVSIDLTDRDKIIQCIDETDFVTTQVQFTLGNRARNYISQLIQSYQKEILQRIIKLRNTNFIRFNTESDLNVLLNAMRVLENITDDLSITLEEFSRSLNKLIQFANDLPDDISMVADIAFRLRFYERFSESENSVLSLSRYATSML